MYYKNTLTRLLTTTKKAIEQTTTNDLRNYLSDFQNTHGVSNVTIDNIRRILSSFFLAGGRGFHHKIPNASYSQGKDNKDC